MDCLLWMLLDWSRGCSRESIAKFSMYPRLGFFLQIFIFRLLGHSSQSEKRQYSFLFYTNTNKFHSLKKNAMIIFLRIDKRMICELLVLIIRYFASWQKRQKYNWCQIDNCAFRYSAPWNKENKATGIIADTRITYFKKIFRISRFTITIKNHEKNPAAIPITAPRSISIG